MTDFILSIVKKNKDKDVKKLILKEFFNYSNQKKIVGKAARESALDQKNLLKKYESQIRSRKQDCVVNK